MEIYSHRKVMPQTSPQRTHFYFPSPHKKEKEGGGEKPNWLYYMYLAKLGTLHSSVLITWLLFSLYAVFLGCFLLEFLALLMCSLVRHSCEGSVNNFTIPPHTI